MYSVTDIQWKYNQELVFLETKLFFHFSSIIHSVPTVDIITVETFEACTHEVCSNYNNHLYFFMKYGALENDFSN